MTSTLTNSAAELNALSAKDLVRVHDDIPGVKKINSIWKGSKASLIARIAAAEAHATPVTEPTKSNGVKHGDQRNSFITTYCLVHGLNAKVIRAKMRKAGFSAPYGENELRVVVDDLRSPVSHYRGDRGKD